MNKITSRFPRNLKRLNCRPQVNYQCGGKCQRLKNKCNSLALGMAKDGMEWLKAVENRRSRIAKVNAKRTGRSQYSIDERGNVSRLPFDVKNNKKKIPNKTTPKNKLTPPLTNPTSFVTIKGKGKTGNGMSNTLNIKIEKAADDALQVKINDRYLSFYPEDYKIKKNGGYYEFDALQEIKRMGYAEDFGLDPQYPGYGITITKEGNQWIMFGDDHEETEFPSFPTKREMVEYARKWAIYFATLFIQNTIDDGTAK